MPPAVVTSTLTGPAVRVAGEVAVISVAESTITPAAGVAPKVTVEAWVKPVPAIVTLVPPAKGPSLTFSELTVGSGS